MAELFGVFGKIRGKLGSTVLRIDRGKNLVSAYNPTKSGTPTDKQIDSRVKMATASAMSKLFPLQAIVGLSPVHTLARSLFVSKLINNCVVSTVGEDEKVGKINVEDIVLSAGTPVKILSSSLLAGTPDNPEVIAGVKFGLSQNVRRFLLVALGQSMATGEYYTAQYCLSTEVLENGSCSAELPLGSGTVLTGMRYYCYAVPMVTDTAHKCVVYNRVLEGTPEGDFTAQAAITFAKADIYRASFYLGVLSFSV